MLLAGRMAEDGSATILVEEAQKRLMHRKPTFGKVLPRVSQGKIGHGDTRLIGRPPTCHCQILIGKQGQHDTSLARPPLEPCPLEPLDANAILNVFRCDRQTEQVLPSVVEPELREVQRDRVPGLGEVDPRLSCGGCPHEPWPHGRRDARREGSAGYLECPPARIPYWSCTTRRVIGLCGHGRVPYSLHLHSSLQSRWEGCCTNPR